MRYGCIGASSPRPCPQPSPDAHPDAHIRAAHTTGRGHRHRLLLDRQSLRYISYVRRALAPKRRHFVDALYVGHRHLRRDAEDPPHPRLGSFLVFFIHSLVYTTRVVSSRAPHTDNLSANTRLGASSFSSADHKHSPRTTYVLLPAHPPPQRCGGTHPRHEAFRRRRRKGVQYIVLRVSVYSPACEEEGGRQPHRSLTCTRTRVHTVVATLALEKVMSVRRMRISRAADVLSPHDPPARCVDSTHHPSLSAQQDCSTGIMAAEGATYDAHHPSAAPAFGEEQVAKIKTEDGMRKEEGEHAPPSSSLPPPPHPFSAGSSSRKRHARCDFEFAGALLFGAANACEHHALSKVEEGVEKMGRAGVVRKEVRENGARVGEEEVDAGPRAQR
ncbi:hypothetical protein B0H16DRAFT_1887284 [Mycena metata]|uniref:Uncharacterized protein n=1 Tax=Mycena metata TaxID=1033252 RepID=A0AAD7J0B8_9AGAR|nr:hypothetical protein B0H16DRAFT_1887284 [Mycena metata]